MIGKVTVYDGTFTEKVSKREGKFKILPDGVLVKYRRPMHKEGGNILEKEYFNRMYVFCYYDDQGERLCDEWIEDALKQNMIDKALDEGDFATLNKIIGRDNHVV